MSKLIVWRFLTSNLRTNKADIKEINLKLIKVTPSYGMSNLPKSSCSVGERTKEQSPSIN
jgi:hypothetical protein